MASGDRSNGLLKLKRLANLKKNHVYYVLDLEVEELKTNNEGCIR